jgi:Ca-activated chloride channel family protein
MDHAKQGVKFATEAMGAGDQVAIVTFSDDARVDLPLQSAADKGAVEAALSRIRPESSTNISDGLERAFRLLKAANPLPGGFTRIILLTDGQANKGVTDQEGLGRFAGTNRGETTISVFGVGSDYNASLMAAVAERGGGSDYHIENGDHIPTFFGREMNLMRNVVHKDAILTITPISANVTVLGVDSTVDPDGGLISVPLGDLLSGETKAVALTVVTTEYQGSDEGLDVEMEEESSPMISLLEAEISWVPVEALDERECEESFLTSELGSQAQSDATVRDDVKLTAWQIALSGALRRATTLSDSGHDDEAKEMLRAAIAPVQAFIDQVKMKKFDKVASDALKILFASAQEALKNLESGSVHGNLSSVMRGRSIGIGAKGMTMGATYSASISPSGQAESVWEHSLSSAYASQHGVETLSYVAATAEIPTFGSDPNVFSAPDDDADEEVES